MTLSVYLVQDEDDFRVVEARDFGEAVAIFKALVEHENGPMPDWQPQSVQLLSDEPVLRALTTGEEGASHGL